MNTDVQSMFDSIKESLSNDKQKSGGASFRNILKLSQGNSYLVRLIPNISDPKATFFHYFHHGWTSNETGQYVDKICPSTYGERCPICEERFKLYKKGDDASKELARQIRRMEKHMVNVFVVNDPTEENNNGEIKVLRFGVRIKEKFDEAIEGDDVDEFGARVFDLTENGCNFKIKVESTQDGNRRFTNYNNSRFTGAGAIPGLTPEKLAEVYENIFDLSAMVTPSTTDELKEMLAVHLYQDSYSKQEVPEVSSNAIEQAVEAASQVVEEEAKEAEPKPEKKAAKKEKPAAVTTETDDKIKDLLAGLDDIPPSE